MEWARWTAHPKTLVHQAAVQGELQRDWAREDTAAGLAEVLSAHGGGTGVAFGWEMQLLGHSASAAV